MNGNHALALVNHVHEPRGLQRRQGFGFLPNAIALARDARLQLST
jgi:hypothetical protein